MKLEEAKKERSKWSKKELHYQFLANEARKKTQTYVKLVYNLRKRKELMKECRD